MIDRQAEELSGVVSWNAEAPVPAARPLSDFCMERVGEDFVVFDAKMNRYHTLNHLAYTIWRSCDGALTPQQLAASMDGADTDLDLVEGAIAQLGESGLLQAHETDFESKMHRRKMMKLVAAGAVGAVGIPVVASITRLGPEASATTCAPLDAFCVSPADCCSGNCNIPSGNPENAKCKK